MTKAVTFNNLAEAEAVIHFFITRLEAEAY